MKKIKRIVYLILIVIFMLSFACCGGGEDSSIENKLPGIEGKNYIFLGSSVFYGANSAGVSFSDLLEEDYKCNSYKVTLSGTSIIDRDNEAGCKSYVARLKDFSKSKLIKGVSFDHLVCQVSTNDTYLSDFDNIVGDINENKDNIEDLDPTATIAEAMEYIYLFTKMEFNCSVTFLICPYFSQNKPGRYEKMMDLTYMLKEKYDDVFVLDFWKDQEFTEMLTREKESGYTMGYMADAVHPKEKGYKEFWEPKVYNHLLNLCE